MEKALFINGIYDDTLEEIYNSQTKNPDRNYFLQPYSTSVIKLLQELKPSSNNPITLYISTTHQLNKICYIADIIAWEDKRNLLEDKLYTLNRHILKYQPKEKEIYLEVNGKKCVNLISIKNLKKISDHFSISNLIKTNNNEPLKSRSMPGGWSSVYKVSFLEINNSAIKDDHRRQFDKQILNIMIDNKLTRKRFIESVGGTCENWNWSWSFINKSKKTIIFGAWEHYNEGYRIKIFSENWKISQRNRKPPGYYQSLEHIRLIENEGYILKTFPMIMKDNTGNEISPAEIKRIIPELTEKKLKKIGNDWFAVDIKTINNDDKIIEDIKEQDELIEVISKEFDENHIKDDLRNLKPTDPEEAIVNNKIYKRNNKTIAQLKIIRHFKCQICKIRIKIKNNKFYIEAAHIIPKAKKGNELPENILILCPNHHKEFDLSEKIIIEHTKEKIIFEMNYKKYEIILKV